MNSKMNIHFPFPGQRIFRSMLAAWLCMAVYYLRGRSGLPFFSVIAALQCIQPYTDNMLTAGKRRVIGTLIGAAWGAAVLYLEYLAIGAATMEEMLHFILMGACAGAVIYFTVLLKIPESAYFSTVVFLSIAMNHVGDSGLMVYVFDRVVDTTIGVAAGILVNSLHLPRIRRKELLFVSGVDQILSGEVRHLSPYTKVELNRLIKDGAHLSVVTKQSPAMIREVLDGVDLKCPVVALDGAVMYDMEKRRYLFAERMDALLGHQVDTFFRQEKPDYFINSVEDHLLVTSYRQMSDGPMKNLFLQRSGSPYRNFVHTEREIRENILNFVTVGTKEEMEALARKLSHQAFSDRIRIEYDSYRCEEGDVILRVYSAEATRERMLKRLKEYLKAEKIIKFGKEEPGADEVISYTGDRMAREIKKRFEKVSIRGWKNMLRI